MSNNLEGTIPFSLAECKNLRVLDLSWNNLTGPVSKGVTTLSSLSQVLDLSANKLNGSIPIEVGKLVNLGVLNIARNKLSGEIPESLGRCTSLETLRLEDNLLQGTIPESLSSLRGIGEIDLSHNNLSGAIPTYLNRFRVLQNLNLSLNNFEGEVPVRGIFNNISAVSIIGNTGLCGGITQLNVPRCISHQSNKTKQSLALELIISVACGLLASLIIILVYFLVPCWSRKTRKLTNSASTFGVSSLNVSYGDLLKATDGFSSTNLIGYGSFGSVFKGNLNNNEERCVAVKVLNLQNSKASKSFIAECEALRGIRHRNLLKLLSACSSIDFQGNAFKALLYEFMVNGSLDEWLHPSNGMNLQQNQRHLNLIQRVNVAIDVASALDYLHNQCHTVIVHCDLKPSNILLDSDMTALIGDFGLARILPDAPLPFPSNQTSSIGVRGSFGYTAPEYGMGCEVSKYGDVYSYGILLLEMLTEKRPTDDMFKDGLDLHKFVMEDLSTKVVEEVLDPIILKREEAESSNTSTSNTSTSIANGNPNTGIEQIHECLVSIAKIGVACSSEMPRDRMEMSNVVAELCLIRDILLGIRRPSVVITV